MRLTTWNKYPNDNHVKITGEQQFSYDKYLQPSFCLSFSKNEPSLLSIHIYNRTII